MSRLQRLGIIVSLSGLLIAACSRAETPSSPSGLPGSLASSIRPNIGLAATSGGGRRVVIMDACDPDSFNAAIAPGTCVNRSGGVKFDDFLALLERHHSVGAWHFSPDTIVVPDDMTLTVENAGGETHTFTEVEEFGGGIVPILNTLSGTPVPAPECLALQGTDFIAAGTRTTHEFEKGEREKYQCCIHPWMRAVTR
jgi:hypothetical protein